MIHFPYQISSKSDDYACARPIFSMVMRTTTTTRHFFQSLSFPFSPSDLHNLAFSLLVLAVAGTILISLSLSLPFSHTILLNTRIVTSLYQLSSLAYISNPWCICVCVRPLKEDCSSPKMYVCEPGILSKMMRNIQVD